MRVASLFPAAALLCFSVQCAPVSLAQAPAKRAAIDLYEKRLAAACGAKHLNFLSPAALNDVVESFTAMQTTVDREAIRASIGQSCTGENGAQCANAGFLQVAVQMRRLEAFVAQVCALKQQCTDPSECTDVK